MLLMMMMSSNSNSSGVRSGARFPFTASQWQELEHQALVYKYMVYGMPVPPDLLFTIRRSLHHSPPSSTATNTTSFLLHHHQHQHQPQHSGWNSFNIGFGKKIDPEPGRCRRTDGKKWRCSKEAYPDSKYCERHMHRGRNRSRKPVENHINILPPPTPNSHNRNATTLGVGNAPQISSQQQQPHMLYSRFLFDSNPKDCRNSSNDGRGIVTKGGGDEHTFFPEVVSNGGGGSSLGSSDFFLGGQKIQTHLDHQRDEHRKKVMHHFLDECPPKERDSWTNSDDKTMMPIHRTQLSISIPNSLHDFFITQK